MSDPEFDYPLLTRQDGLDLVETEYGIRVSHSKLERDLIDRPDDAPKPAARFGRKLLYEAKEWRRYAQTLIKKIEPGYFKPGPGRTPKVRQP